MPAAIEAAKYSPSLEAAKYSPSLEAAFRIAEVFGNPLEEVFVWEQ